MNSGMIATGNHGYFDSLRGAPPQRGSQENAKFQFLYPLRHGDQQKKLFRLGNFPGFTLDIPILSGYNKFGIVYAGGELPPVFHG